MAVDWFRVVMWFDTLSSLSVRMWTRGLVRPLFVAQTTWFGIPDFCNTEEEWVRHGVEDHEVRDGNGLQVGSELVKELQQSVKSPL